MADINNVEFRDNWDAKIAEGVLTKIRQSKDLQLKISLKHLL